MKRRVRRVAVTLELETDFPAQLLRTHAWWHARVRGAKGWAFKVLQVQVNVIRQRD